MFLFLFSTGTCLINSLEPAVRRLCDLESFIDSLSENEFSKISSNSGILIMLDCICFNIFLEKTTRSGK